MTKTHWPLTPENAIFTAVAMVTLLSKKLPVWLTAGWCCFCVPRTMAGPIINEFLASNSGTSLDDQGLSSDWIELFNPDNTPVDLAGWSLTDDADRPRKWIFPAVTLAAQEYLVVRASGLDLTVPGKPLHANFKLAAGGGFLGLYPPTGPAASVWQPYPKQFRNISYGQSGSVAPPAWMPEPSPGGVNSARILTDYVKDTTFDLPGGFIHGPNLVKVRTPTDGAVIRYTLEGSEPSSISPPFPTGGLTFPTTTVLRVRAFKDGFVPTNTDTRTWILPSAWISQPAKPPGFPQTWGYALRNGSPDPVLSVLADYAMDPRVTSHAGMEAALTETLPVLCVNGPVDAIFGLNGVMGNGRTGSLEEPVSVEFFNPAKPDDRFSARASFQAHGGGVREFAKKAFRLDFSGAFGDGALGYPLFPGSKSERFDQLVLRPGGHDSFTVQAAGLNTLDQYDVAAHGSYLRDQFIRRTENRMGLLSPHGRYVHLCLNGLYWGLYDLHERPNARYAVAHQGGQEADWDVIHHGPQTVDGNDDAWNDLLSKSALASTPAEYQAVSDRLGPDDFIDHILTRIWAADFDWLGPATMPGVDGLGPTSNVAFYEAKNWYALKRSRGTAPLPWQFFTWDAEISMGNHVLYRWTGVPISQFPANFSWPVPHRQLNFDFTGISSPNTPAEPWAALLADPEFRLRVADRLRRHCFHGGALSPASASAEINAMILELDAPILAESARWGDVSGYGIDFSGPNLVRKWTNTLITRDGYWRPEVAWLRDTFATQRSAIVVAQFKARGVYPLLEAAEASPAGGALAAGQTVNFSQPDAAAVIYFTTDGTDPRVPRTGVTAPAARIASGPIVPPAPTPLTIKTRVFKAGVWSALTEFVFDPARLPTAASLVITEIHYHPAAPTAAEILAGWTDEDDFEFLEITNRSSGSIDLRSLRFAAGLDFDFATGSSLSELQAGRSLVIASNAAAFKMRYGTDPAGSFANGTRLSNAGERLKLVTTSGVVIFEMVWDDQDPWPTKADGAGRSLTLLAPFSGSDGTGPDQWRAGIPTPLEVASSLPFSEWQTDYFTTGELANTAVSGPNADPDHDGLENLVEYLTVSPPRTPSPGPISITTPSAGLIRFEWSRRADATGFVTALELSGDLQSWIAATSASGVQNSTLPTGSGRVLHRSDRANPGLAGYARLVVRDSGG